MSSQESGDSADSLLAGKATLKNAARNEVNSPSGLEEGKGSMTVDEIIEEIGVNRYQWLLVAILAMANIADAVEITMMRYLLTAYEDRSGNPMSTDESSFLSAAVFCGMLVGGLCAGVVSDRFGRRPALLAALIINGTCGVLSAGAPSTTALICIRVVAGVGIGGTVPIIFTLAVEFAPKTHRGQFVNIIAWNWMTGSLMVALIAWLMLELTPSNEAHWAHDWRAFAFVCSLPALLGCALVWIYLPESPRWTAERGQKDETKKILQSIAIRSKKVMVIRLSVSERRQQEQTLKESLEIIFKNPYLRKCCILLMVLWFALSYGNYGLSTWVTFLFNKAKLEDIYLNSLIFAGGQLPGNLVAFFLIDRVDRRRLLFASMLVSAGCALSFAYVLDKGAVWIVISAAAFNGISTMGWNVLDCLAAEYFPTSVRTTAIGIQAATGRMGSMSAQFINGHLAQTGRMSELLAVTASTMTLGGMCILFVPKLRRTEDEETV